MLIDIPDAGIILVSVLAFLSGLVTLYCIPKYDCLVAPKRLPQQTWNALITMKSRWR